MIPGLVETTELDDKPVVHRMSRGGAVPDDYRRGMARALLYWPPQEGDEFTMHGFHSCVVHKMHKRHITVMLVGTRRKKKMDLSYFRIGTLFWVTGYRRP